MEAIISDFFVSLGWKLKSFSKSAIFLFEFCLLETIFFLEFRDTRVFLIIFSFSLLLSFILGDSGVGMLGNFSINLLNSSNFESTDSSSDYSSSSIVGTLMDFEEALLFLVASGWLK